MAKPVVFIGSMTQNGVLATLYNMIISQEVFSDNISIKGTLAEDFRIDGTLYGDTKLFTSTDIGTIYDFPNSSKNLLSKTQPTEPKVQAVKVDTFKQTAVTVDGVKLKQAFMSADIYGAFVGVIVNWLRDSMRVLNMTLINAFIGTLITEAQNAEIDVDFDKYGATTGINVRDLRSYEAEIIGEEIANLMVDLEDATRDYNDYGFLRSYDLSDFRVIWNKSWANRIKHISLPKIFHKDDVMGKALEGKTINSRYFGDVLTVAGTADGLTTRTLIDTVIADKQYFPGDILPSTTAYGAYEAYTADDKVICKIVHKRAIPFMSALVMQTEFFNPKDLDRNHYLTWGYSTPTYLANYPVITLKDVTV